MLVHASSAFPLVLAVSKAVLCGYLIGYCAVIYYLIAVRSPFVNFSSDLKPTFWLFMTV